MNYRVLGPLEIDVDGCAVELGGARQRELLALLLLRHGEVVSADLLIEDLYGDERPAKAGKSLQVLVSRLRKTLPGNGHLLTRGGGYLLDTHGVEIDAEIFDRLVSDGITARTSAEPVRAIGLLKEALGLWRGPPFADVAYRDFAQSEIARLEELRAHAREELLEARLENGRGAELVGELESLIREYPLRERPRAQLMLALYRAGRQAEALAVFADARRALVDGLGIEPGRPLRELERAILEQNPELDALAVVSLEGVLSTEVSPEEGARAAAVREGRRNVTVLGLDLVTDDDAGELDPEAVRRVAADVRPLLEETVERHGGQLASIGPDGACAVFGVPAAHEDDALRAVRAASEARDALARLAGKLEQEGTTSIVARLAVVTGQVVTGGEAGTLLAVSGEPLTRSARLAREAQAGEIALDQSTARLVESAAVVRQATAGKTPVSYLVALRPDGPSRPDRFGSPMVGRERERRRLRDVFDQALASRSCQLVTVVGAAGVGKSRLVREFLDDVREEALVARGRCLPYGEGITYWPVVEIVRDLAQLPASAPLAQLRERLAALVAATEEPEQLARRLTEAIGLAEATVSADESFEVVRRFVEAVACARPLVLVLDDIHWGEPTFLDLVERLADRTHGEPLVLLCLARHELHDVRPGWAGGKLNAASTLLEPLSESECDVLIANLLGDGELPKTMRTRIAEASGGNPLFVEETISMLVDDGVLVAGEDGWIAQGDLATVPIPDTLQALLTARLDGLTPAEREALERASVEGRLFHVGWVRGAADARPPEELETLVRKELIRPQQPFFADEHAYRFRHLLIRDAAYASISKAGRAELHERHADWLLARPDERSVELEEIVGYHLEQAFSYRTELHPIDAATRSLGQRGAEHFGIAGRRAFARSDAPAGVNLVSRAVAMLAADDRLRVELVPNVRVIQGDYDLGWADQVLTEAVEAAATNGDRSLAAHALVQRGFLRLFNAPEVAPHELHEVAQRAIAVFDELADELGLARAWRLVGQAHYLDRRIERCAEASERALLHAKRADDSFEVRELVEWLVIALLLGPRPAEEAIDRCTVLLAEHGDAPLVRAGILAALAPLRAMQGDLDEARRLIDESGNLMRAAGEWIWLALYWQGYVAMWHDDPEAAEEVLRPGYEALKRMGETSHFSSLSHALSDALYAQARYDETESLTHECELACRPNDVNSEILWRSIRAKVLARRGDFPTAEMLSRDALALAESSDFLPAHADALFNWGEALHLAGREDEAEVSFAAAAAAYEAKGNLLAARRARAALAGG